MQLDKTSRNKRWKASSRLAFVSAALAILLATGFAILLPSQIEAGKLGSVRWFAVSAFPLAVVLWIAVFTRLQKQIDQKTEPSDGSAASEMSR